MTKTFNALKAELLQIKEEIEMKDIITKLDNRKAKLKEEAKAINMESFGFLLPL